MELFVGEKAVTTTMQAKGLKVASIVWGPDALDFMCHGLPAVLPVSSKATDACIVGVLALC